MSPKVIVVTGTPGTGKTSIGRLLSEKIRGHYINLSDLVLTEKMYVGYDEDRESYIIDEKIVVRKIRELYSTIKEDFLIIDTHYPEVVPGDIVYAYIVLRIKPSELKKRLVNRGWKTMKVVENVEAELLGSCSISVRSVGSKAIIVEVDVSNGDPEKVVEKILDSIKEGKSNDYIDWTIRLQGEELEEIIKWITAKRSMFRRE